MSIGVLFSQTVSAHATDAGEVSYPCRGKIVSFLPEESAVAVEIVGDLKTTSPPTIAGETPELLYSNRDLGRYVWQFPSVEAAMGLRAEKSDSFRFYPVYRYKADPTIVVSDFGEIVLRLEEGTKHEFFQEFCEDRGLRIVQQSPLMVSRYLLVPAEGPGGTAFEWADRLRRLPFVKWAEPNLYGGARLQFTPNDPYYPNQTHIRVVDAPKAWDETTGSSDVVVAVVDEGVDVSHPDLAGNIWVNSLEASGSPGVDDDGNGYTDDLNGWDFTSGGDPDLTPNTVGLGGHGTAVAGIIAARQNNGVGVSGLAPVVKILSCRLWQGGSYSGNLAAANSIEYAARYADVINLSWTAIINNPVLDALDYSVTSGRDGKGSLVVCAAGNDGDPVHFPADYEWCVAVGESSDETDIKHTESSFGKELALMAPVGMWTTDNSGAGNGWDTWPEEVSPDPDYTGIFGGTSSAAPQVSALAALVFSTYPGLTAGQAAAVLVNSVDNPEPGFVPNDLYGKSTSMGYGRMNAHRAVKASLSSADDRLEPNDHPGEAAEVGSGHYRWLYLGSNLDYYKIHGIGGAPIRCTLSFLSLIGEIEASLLDEDLQEVATSTTVAGPGGTVAKKVNYLPPITGDFFLEVRSAAGVHQPYVMDVRAGVTDDSYEPNDSLSRAVRLFPGGGKTYGGLVLNGNSDYFKTDVEEGKYLYSLSTFDLDKGDLSMQVIDPDTVTVVGSADEITYGEQIDPLYVDVDGGTYYLRVFSQVGDLNPEYALHLAVSNNGPIVGAGNDDAFEDNDSFATATPVNAGFYPRLSLDITGSEDDDYFAFTIPAGKMARFTIGWSVPGVDLDIGVYDDVSDPPNAVPIARSTLTGVRVESVTLSPYGAPKQVWVVVYRQPSGTLSQTPYQMALEFLNPAPSPWVAFWRLNEGAIGTSCDPLLIRDWRGPRLSNSPQGYSSLDWVSGPNPFEFPGSDGIALDCSMGGVYFPNNGDEGELSLLNQPNQPFSIWARFKPLNTSALRTIATVPGVWEFYVGSDGFLKATIHSGVSTETYGGPPVRAGVWQDAAFVWDPVSGIVRLVGTSEGGLVEVTSPIGLGYSGTETFHIGSSSGGSMPLGAVEQVRFYDEAMTVDQFQPFSSSVLPAGHDAWLLYE